MGTGGNKMVCSDKMCQQNNVKGYRVVYLSNVPAPYTVDFYNELGKYVDLTVLFERETATNRNAEWFTGKVRYFRQIFLKGIKSKTENAFCPSVTKYLQDKNTVYIVGDYSSPTGMLAILYLKYRRVPFMIHADGGAIKNEATIKKKIKQFFLSSGSAFFSPGKQTDDYFLYYGRKDVPIYRYPFTSIREADVCQSVLTREDKLKKRQKIGLYDESLVALFVGSISHGKGIDILIKAANMVVNTCTIHVVGGMPTKEIQEQIDREHTYNVIFHEFVKPNEVFEYMRCADMFVLPTRHDVWGLVINEAMSQGLPVITTDQCVAGVEMIKDGLNGFVIPSEDPNALAERINYFVNFPEEMYRMGIQSLIVAKEYTIEKMVTVYAQHIADFAARNERY